MERLGHLEAVIERLQNQIRVGSSSASASNELIQGEPRDSKPSGSENQIGELQNEFGRLAVGNGKSRYITSNFWASIHEEVRRYIMW
jgi:hypothetical protein